jgi:hypothetical protein
METQQPAQLHFVEDENSWRGEDDSIEVIATDEAFKRHTLAYLKQRGIDEPKPQQIRAAQQIVVTVAYWNPLVGADERDVHVRYKNLRENPAPLGGWQ